MAEDLIHHPEWTSYVPVQSLMGLECPFKKLREIKEKAKALFGF